MGEISGLSLSLIAQGFLEYESHLTFRKLFCSPGGSSFSHLKQEVRNQGFYMLPIISFPTGIIRVPEIQEVQKLSGMLGSLGGKEAPAAQGQLYEVPS